MTPELRRIVVLTGPFGSGKTELAIGLALQARAADALNGSSTRIALADLDVLKPYFRSREASEALQSAGIMLVAPTGALAHSDLPILTAELRGTVPRADVRMFLDVGGDPVGARALGSISDVVGASEHEMLLVLNRYRPFMDTFEQVLETARQIESASHLSITSIVSNTHMLDETTADDVRWGWELSAEVARALGVCVRLLGVPEHLQTEFRPNPEMPPILVVRRFMKPNFMGGVVLSPPRHGAGSQQRSDPQ